MNNINHNTQSLFPIMRQTNFFNKYGAFLYFSKILLATRFGNAPICTVLCEKSWNGNALLLNLKEGRKYKLQNFKNHRLDSEQAKCTNNVHQLPSGANGFQQHTCEAHQYAHRLSVPLFKWLQPHVLLEWLDDCHYPSTAFVLLLINNVYVFG